MAQEDHSSHGQIFCLGGKKFDERLQRLGVQALTAERIARRQACHHALHCRMKKKRSTWLPGSRSQPERSGFTLLAL
jgi:hypothetical protein